MPRCVIILHPSFDRQNGPEIISDYIDNMKEGIFATLAAAKDTGLSPNEIKALAEHLSKFRFYCQDLDMELVS